MWWLWVAKKINRALNWFKIDKMKVLIACEESQAVCIEFRKRGHEAYSCDIQECSGGYPEWHYQEDIFKVIEREHWDMMIAFPPCTHLAVSGAAWFEDKRRQTARWY